MKRSPGVVNDQLALLQRESITLAGKCHLVIAECAAAGKAAALLTAS
jgi:hypothetical protein